MRTKVLECGVCKAKTPHNFLREVKFTSRYRTITNKTYECKVCKSKKTIKHEKQNKNVQIWD